MSLAELLLNIKWHNFSKEYNKLLKSSHKSILELQKTQLIEFKDMLSYATKNVDYYKNNKEYNIDLSNVDNLYSVLNKLPVIDKQIIKSKSESFISKSYKDKVFDKSTGGSTGEPFRFKMSFEDLKYSRLLKYRGYSYAGFSIGDNIIILGGGSLINKSKNNPIKFLKSKLINVKKIASYGINDNDFEKIYNYINKKSKIFIYGYASTIYLLAKYINSNSLKLKDSVVKGVFTTSELLTLNQRKLIEEVFGNVVFDDYGVNDGGASAHECEAHNGLHLDMERAIIEVVDQQNNSIQEGYGRIVVTSLKNRSMPFIRYETGDYAEITYKKCVCGRETPRLLRILGRTTDYLYFKGRYIGSPVLTVLMGKLDVDFYQIIQKDYDLVLFKVYKGEGFNQEMIEFIKNHVTSSMMSYFDDIRIIFEFCDKLPDINNKHKYIINEYLNKIEFSE